MTNDEVLARVVAVLQETFDIEPERIRPEARLYDDLDIDSIDAIDLIVKLKPILNKPPKPEQFKAVRTVQDVVDVLERLIDTPASTEA